MLPRFADIADRYGSLTRGVLANLPRKGDSAGPLFRTLKGGLGQMVDAVMASIRGKAELRQVSVDTIQRAPSGFRVRAGGDWIEADNVVVACEAHNAARLLDGRLAELLSGIDYSSSIVMAFAYDVPPPMPGFGFLVPLKERRRIVACTWLGAKFGYRVPAGKTLARCFLSGEDDPDPMGIHRELCELTGLRVAPVFQRVFKWPRSMAQYRVGHAGRVAEIQTLSRRMPGLHLIGNAYNGIGIPDCIRSGKQAAEGILGNAP